MDFASVSHFAPLSVWILQEFRIFQLCDTEMIREGEDLRQADFGPFLQLKLHVKPNEF